MDYRLRFWAEHLSPAEVAERAMSLLSEFGAGVGVALFRNSIGPASAAAFRRMKEAGVEVAFWPLLDPEEGYFPNERNVPAFSRFLAGLLDWAEEEGVLPDIVAFDLEMPFDQMMSLMEGSPVRRLAALVGTVRANKDMERYRSAKAGLVEMVEAVKGRGARALVAALPWVALELGSGREVMQDLMETPIDGVPWDVIHPMWYASMLEGLSGGSISQADANWLAYDASLWLRNRFGEAAGISLGVTGTGVLGNEKTFSHPGELLAGVEAALAAGIRDIGVYNLEGILERGDPQEWLRALRAARPRVPERSGKAARALALVRDLYPFVARMTS